MADNLWIDRVCYNSHNLGNRIMGQNLRLLSVSDYSRNILRYLNRNISPVSNDPFAQRLRIQIRRQRRIHGEKDAGNDGGASVYGEVTFVRPNATLQLRRAVPYNTAVANIDDIWLRDEDTAKWGDKYMYVVRHGNTHPFGETTSLLLANRNTRCRHRFVL